MQELNILFPEGRGPPNATVVEDFQKLLVAALVSEDLYNEPQVLCRRDSHRGGCVLSLMCLKGTSDGTGERLEGHGREHFVALSIRGLIQMS